MSNILDGLSGAKGVRLHNDVRLGGCVRDTEGISDRSAEILKTLAQHPDGIGPTALAAAHGRLVDALARDVAGAMAGDR